MQPALLWNGDLLRPMPGSSFIAFILSNQCGQVLGKAKPACVGYIGLFTQLPSALGSALRSLPVRDMADYVFKDHQPSALRCEARLRGLYSSTFNVQPSTFNLQRSTFNLQPPSTTFNVQPSTFNLQPPSTFNLQPSTFNLQSSTFNHLQRSTFNVQRSTFNLQPSTFNLQPSPLRAQRRLCPGRLRSRAGWNGSRGEDPPQFWCHSRAR